MIVWPPTYKIRKHRLTKNVKLIASKKQGLIVSVPSRFSARNIPALLEENKAWIVEQFQKINLSPTHVLPTTIHLTAMDQVWRVSFQSSTSGMQLIIRPQQEIVILAKAEIAHQGCQLLKKWLREQASEYLINELYQLSQGTGLIYNKVIIRDQATRWGSCTSNKTLSLNYKLIFLPYPLLRHILIHELCHTIEMNHSARFWLFVAKYDPDYLFHRKAMQAANQYLPNWL